MTLTRRTSVEESLTKHHKEFSKHTSDRTLHGIADSEECT